MTDQMKIQISPQMTMPEGNTENNPDGIPNKTPDETLYEKTR
jgi:hypothetical protein